MNNYEVLNELLVTLFNEIMDIEEKAIISGEFTDITNNDMHVIEAIGISNPRNMTSVANALSVTVGTLTIAVNNLVKKGYVERTRSEKDRRVVLISLTAKGKKAYEQHMQFHEKMIEALTEKLPDDQMDVLIRTLINLKDFFRSYDQK